MGKTIWYRGKSPTSAKCWEDYCRKTKKKLGNYIHISRGKYPGDIPMILQHQMLHGMAAPVTGIGITESHGGIEGLASGISFVYKQSHTW